MCSGSRPSRAGAALDVGVIFPGAGQSAAAGRKDHLGGLGGELPPGVRRPGLHDDRPALHRPRDVQRSAHRQEFAPVIEHMHPLGIEIEAVLDIADKSVLGPAVPQPGDDIEELAGPAIALAMLHVLGQPEIERRVGVRGRHQVPPGAPAADMVERGEPARDQIGRLERRRGRRDQPQMLGHHRQRRQQRQRIERGHRGAALQRRHRHVQDRQMIGHEPRVEPSALELLREADQVLQVEIGVGIGARIAPPRRMNAHRAHERAEPQPPIRRHLSAPPPPDQDRGDLPAIDTPAQCRRHRAGGLSRAGRTGRRCRKTAPPSRRPNSPRRCA